MPPKTLNQVLAENLAALMRDLGVSQNALGASAGLSPRTISNYLAPQEAGTQPSSGKERSAKLAEVQMLADALGVHPLALLTDPGERLSVVRSLMDRMAAETAPVTTADAPIARSRKRANGR